MFSPWLLLCACHSTCGMGIKQCLFAKPVFQTMLDIQYVVHINKCYTKAVLPMSPSRVHPQSHFWNLMLITWRSFSTKLF